MIGFSNPPRIALVGAGRGGPSALIRLAHHGFHVEDCLSFVGPPVVCRYSSSDGTIPGATADIERSAREIETKTGEPAGHLHIFLRHDRRVYESVGDPLLRHNLHDTATCNLAAFGKSLFNLCPIDPLRAMDIAVGFHFLDPRMRQLFDRFATRNGSDLFRTPATLNVVPHAEYNLGGFAMEEGIQLILIALERLARELGVVLAAGEVDSFDAEVSCVDVALTYRNPFADGTAPGLKQYEPQNPPCSGALFYRGMKEPFPELTINRIFFLKDYRAEFRAIFREQRLPDDPTVHVIITSGISTRDAPQGDENRLVLVNAPNDNGQDWAAESLAVRKPVFDIASQRLRRRIEPAIAVEKTMNPGEIAERTGSYRGNLYGISSNSRPAAFLRQPNRSNRYPGLYLCGGSVHPGGGMPLAPLFGRTGADFAAKDFERAVEGRRGA